MNKNTTNDRLRAAAIPPKNVFGVAGDEPAAKALAYYRVSTSEQANTSYDEDGFSIQAQREYCHRKAGELGARIGDGDEYIDRGKSARSADRPELRKMLKRVADDPEVKYVIVHKIDRLARSREDDVMIVMQLAKHGVKLVSATENIDETPGGKLVHGIMATIAEWYSGNLSQEARKGLRKKVEIGGTPGKAPLGYKNIRDKRKGKDIGLVVVDPVMGPLITEAFKLYASGVYTISDLVDELNERGLRMAETKALPERPVQVSHVHRILHNRYYMGVITYNNVEYPGEHQPLVDEATFETVQAILTARNLNKDKSKQRPHPLKGNLHCARCGRRLGICAPTNRYGTTYPYFYCLGRQADPNTCNQPYISVERIEAAVVDYWQRLRVPTARLRRLRDEIMQSFAGRHAEGQAEIKAQEDRIRRLNQRARKNKEAYFADALSLEDFKAEQDATKNEITAAEKIIQRLTVSLASIERSLDEALTILMDPGRLFVEAPDGIKLLLAQVVFEKVWILDDAVAGSELTPAFRELLTVDARLALEDEQVARATDEVQLVPRQRSYYRRVGAVGDDQDDEADLSGLMARLWIERPGGYLPVDRLLTSKNPGSHQGNQGSNVLHLVGVAGFEPTAPRSQSECATKLRHTPCPAALETSRHAGSISNAFRAPRPGARA